MQLTHQVAEGNGNNKTMLFVIWICNSSVFACAVGRANSSARMISTYSNPKEWSGFSIRYLPTISKISSHPKAKFNTSLNRSKQKSTNSPLGLNMLF